MAYNPTNWECGDVVTAEKLNKLEEAVEDLSLAIEGGGSELPLTIGVTTEGSRSVMDKTWQEIANVYPCARIVHSNGYLPVGEVLESGGKYRVVVPGETPKTFQTDSASGYPTYVGGLN